MNGTHFQPVQQVVRGEAKIGRNDPCPCASGKKYKKCCEAQEGTHLKIYLRAHTEKFSENEKPRKCVAPEEKQQPDRLP